MFRPHTVHAQPLDSQRKQALKSPYLWFRSKKTHKVAKTNHIYIAYIHIVMKYDIWHMIYAKHKKTCVYIYTYMTNTHTHIYINGWSYLILSNLHFGICFFTRQLLTLASPPANPWGFAQFFKFGWPADLWWHVLLVGAEILHILLALHRGCLGRWLEKIMISRLETYQKKCSSS